MERCEVCGREFDIIGHDVVMIPGPSGLDCPCGAWIGIFAPFTPFAYQERGGEWHRVADGARLTASTQ